MLKSKHQGNYKHNVKVAIENARAWRRLNAAVQENAAMLTEYWGPGGRVDRNVIAPLRTAGLA